MKPVKLICFDLDDTLISQHGWKNSWYALNKTLGISDEEDERWLNEYLSGSIDYERWNEILLERYKQHPDANREQITNVLTDVTYTDWARESVKYLRSRGYQLVLISGSIDIVVSFVARELGFELAKANNTFVFDDNERLAAIHSLGDERIAKTRHLESFCDQLGVGIDECACIGDGANDLDMFQRTGRGITFRGSKIEAAAWKVIDSLRDIPTIFP